MQETANFDDRTGLIGKRCRNLSDTGRKRSITGLRVGFLGLTIRVGNAIAGKATANAVRRGAASTVA
jgi:hypothetical protein